MFEATTGKKKNIVRRFFEVREIGALIPLVIILVAASLSNPAFISLPNVLNMIRALNRSFRQTVLMITHNAEAAAVADRVVRMRDGRIVSD